MLWFEVINKTCNCGQFRQSSMARAASGQLGIARTGAVPPEIRNRPRLNAIASSSGSVADNRPLGGNVRDAESVAIVRAAAAIAGRPIEQRQDVFLIAADVADLGGISEVEHKALDEIATSLEVEKAALLR